MHRHPYLSAREKTNCPRSPLRAVAWVLALGGSLCGRDALADLVIDVEAVSVSTGSAGSFDVLLRNTNDVGGDSYALASDTVQFALSGLTGVTITGATIETAAPYIYLISGTTLPDVDPFVTSSTATTFLASDSEFDPLGFSTIAPGQTVGLAHVLYHVASDATVGIGTISLAGSNLSDGEGNAVDVRVLDGQFRIRPVPEPSGLALAVIGLPILIVAISRRRRAGNARLHDHMAYCCDD